MARRLVLLACLIAVGAIASGSVTPGHSATHPANPTKGYPITRGEHTRQVCNALWLMRAEKPSRYRAERFAVWKQRVPTRKACRWTAKAGRAVVQLKKFLGYPKTVKVGRKTINARRPVFGRDLRRILLGKERPKEWRARAVKFAPPPFTRGQFAAELARRELAKHPREIWGRNWGPEIKKYQTVTHYTYRLAWCVSFAQWVVKAAGLGTFADRSAGVHYSVTWASRRGWTTWLGDRGWSRGPPSSGMPVGFTSGHGHMGVVERATPGGVYTIEGNASDTILRRFTPYRGGRPMTFIRLPGLTKAAR